MGAGTSPLDDRAAAGHNYAQVAGDLAPFAARMCVAAAFVAGAGACARTPAPRARSAAGAVQGVGVVADPDALPVVDPTVRGPRLFPEVVDDAHGWGVEPDGGVRLLVAGIRFVSMPDGSVATSPDRIPAAPSCAISLPDRLGGGFLFAAKARVWRSDAWLGAAAPFAQTPQPIDELRVGLDRIYARSRQTLFALDARTGSPTSLGPVPPSPHVADFAALDAWRAVAIADLHGVLLTTDAGATWRSLALPIAPTDARTLKGAFAVGGLGDGRRSEWWEVRPDGEFDPLSAEGAANAPAHEGGPASAVGPLGPHPLVAAVEDGWPVGDGTALVARDGALARVRLRDGAIVELSPDAFPFQPARCHPISLARPGDPDVLALDCGEAGGRTVLYRWSGERAGLVELRRFDSPRQVLGFGDGALAVRGPCAADQPGGPELAGDDVTRHATKSLQAWCWSPPVPPKTAPDDVPWREARFDSSDRVVVTSDGRIVAVRPPGGSGHIADARLVFGSGAGPSRPLAFPTLASGVARALGLGVWMDGFEERRPGVLGGWIDAAGSIVGVEIRLTGEVRVGEYVRDAGAPMPSGRWAFGWTASRGGFETTDGGMHWTKEIPLPDALSTGRLQSERACGPVGCIAAGWLRIGWGGEAQAVAPEPRPSSVGGTGRSRHRTRIDLDCEPDGPSGPVHPFPSDAELGPSRGDARLTMTVTRGFSLDAHNAAMARLDAWTRDGGDPNEGTQWRVWWRSPWAGGFAARSSTPARAPWASIDAARRALTATMGGEPLRWALAPSDDPDHALLLESRFTSPPTADLIALETGRSPLAVPGPDGGPWPAVESAIRLAGRWYVATASPPGRRPDTFVWALDGAGARLVARVPRVATEPARSLHLSRYTDGRTLGLVVDGDADPARGTTAMRWVAAIDPASGSVAEPEPLAPADFSDRDVVACTGDATGWIVELPTGPIVVHLPAPGPSADAVEARLSDATAWMRVSRERACIDHVIGRPERDGLADSVAALRRLPDHGTAPPTRARNVSATLVTEYRELLGLRCAVR